MNIFPKTILIVEDTPAITDVMRWALSQQGYAIVPAANCDEATLRLQEFVVDLAIVNLSMPGVKRPTQLITELIQMEPPVPVLICTAATQNEISQVTRATGVKNLLKKPFKLADLFAEVNKLLP